MKDFFKMVLKFLIRNLTPKNRIGDKFIAYVDFYRDHGRLPKKDFGLSDKLFEVKTTDDILLPERGFTTDKEYVKLFIKAVLGDEYNVPTKAVLKTQGEVDHYFFKAGSVVKPTHASGRVKFVDEDNVIDREEIKSWLNLNYHNFNREANYKYLKPKIIIEPFIFGCKSVVDIKFICIEGRVKSIMYVTDRDVNHTLQWFNRNWNLLHKKIKNPVDSIKIKEKPENLGEMIKSAELLAGYFGDVRVDMYLDDKTSRYLVGEITHCSFNANAAKYYTSSEAETRINSVHSG